MSQDTAARLELQALKDILLSELDNYQHDPEMLGLITAAENPKDIAAKLEATLDAINAILPLITAVEMFAFGDLGEPAFRKRWKSIKEAAEEIEEKQATSVISSDVQSFLNNIKGSTGEAN